MYTMLPVFILFFHSVIFCSLSSVSRNTLDFLTDFGHDSSTGITHFEQVVEAGVKMIFKSHPVHEEYRISLTVATIISGLYAPQFIAPKIMTGGIRFFWNWMQKKIVPVSKKEWEDNPTGFSYEWLRCRSFFIERKKEYLQLKELYDPRKILINFIDIFLNASIYKRDSSTGDIVYQDASTYKKNPLKEQTGFFVHYSVHFAYDLIVTLTLRAALFSLFYHKIYKKMFCSLSWFDALDKKIIRFFSFNRPVVALRKKLDVVL